MNDILRLLRTYVLPHWGRVALIALTALIAGSSPYVLGYLGKVMVDDVLQVQQGPGAEEEQEAQGWVEPGGAPEPDTEQDDAEPDAGRSSGDKKRLLLRLFLAYVAVRLFFIACQWVYAYTVTYVGQRLVYQIRGHLHEKLQQLQMSYFDKQQPGRLLSRVLDDVGVVQYSVSGVLVQLITQVGMAAVGAAILLRLNWRLAIIAFVTVPFYALMYRLVHARLRVVNRKIRRQNASIYGLVSERISGIRVVQSYVRERYEIRRYVKRAAQLLRLQFRNATINGVLSLACGLIASVGTALVLYYGALQVKRAELTLGGLLYFHAAAASLFGPVLALTYMNIIVQWVLAALRRVFEVLDEEVSIKDAPGAVPLVEMRGEVVFGGVSLKYEGASTYALRDVSFRVPAGSVVCLVGASGSGKSSIVSLLLRLYDPTEGSIRIDGHDLKHIQLHSLRDHIGIVPQEPTVFSGTIAENIMYGHVEATPSQVVAAAQAAELHDFIYSLPEKYEAEIGERGTTLSGGQRQRLAFAMALITDPSLLVLDDSMSALDAQTEAKIQETLDRVMRGRTTFIITHRMSTAMMADLILVLDKGRVVQQGSHDSLVGTPGLYRDMFELQQRQGA